MLGRDKIALVRKFSKDQAALQEQLKDLGRDPMLKRLDVPENCAESKMSAWLRRRQVNQQPAPADDWNQEELDPVVEILHAANPPQMPRPARPRAADPGNLETEDPPSDDLSSVENVCSFFIFLRNLESKRNLIKQFEIINSLYLKHLLT